MSSEATDRSSLPFFAMQRRGVSASVQASAASATATDEELLLRLEAGDYSAVDLLFDRYAALIFGIALRTIHDRGEAEDLVQDVFLHLCQKAKGFDAVRGSARSWIVQIAYRRAFDRRAYLSRRKFYDGTDVELLSNTLGMSADAGLDGLLAADELNVGLAGLTEKQRQTLKMFFFDGLDFREISQRLEESVDNTRHSYYRGLEKLRRAVAPISRRNGK